MKELGEQLIKARLAAGFTQERLADEIKVTRQTISSWERDKSQPDIAFVVAMSKALNCRFVLDDEVVICPMSQTIGENTPIPISGEGAPEAAPARKRTPLRTLIAFIAGVLAALLVVCWVVPMFDKSTPEPYSIAKNEGGSSGPPTVNWFKSASVPHEDKPYVVVSFSENPVYAHKNPDFANGVGWKYTVYLTEYNGKDFFPESYTMYYFTDEQSSVTNTYSARDLEMWWGENKIPARGQRHVRSGDPLQNIIGVGIELSGKDANGETMVFRGFIECSQEIKD